MDNDKILKDKIYAKGTEITIISSDKADDYISITDIAKYVNSESPADVVKNWMRNYKNL